MKSQETGVICVMFFHANDDVDDDDKVEGGCVDTDVQGILASESPLEMSRLTKHRQRYPLRLRLSPCPPGCDEDYHEGNGDEDDEDVVDGGAKNRLSPPYDSMIHLNNKSYQSCDRPC